jgi:hypothetical protein
MAALLRIFSFYSGLHDEYSHYQGSTVAFQYEAPIFSLSRKNARTAKKQAQQRQVQEEDPARDGEEDEEEVGNFVNSTERMLPPLFVVVRRCCTRNSFTILPSKDADELTKGMLDEKINLKEFFCLLCDAKLTAPMDENEEACHHIQRHHGFNVGSYAMAAYLGNVQLLKRRQRSYKDRMQEMAPNGGAPNDRQQAINLMTRAVDTLDDSGGMAPEFLHDEANDLPSDDEEQLQSGVSVLRKRRSGARKAKDLLVTQAAKFLAQKDEGHTSNVIKRIRKVLLAKKVHMHKAAVMAAVSFQSSSSKRNLLTRKKGRNGRFQTSSPRKQGSGHGFRLSRKPAQRSETMAERRATKAAQELKEQKEQEDEQVLWGEEHKDIKDLGHTLTPLEIRMAFSTSQVRAHFFHLCSAIVLNLQHLPLACVCLLPHLVIAFPPSPSLLSRQSECSMTVVELSKLSFSEFVVSIIRCAALRYESQLAMPLSHKVRAVVEFVCELDPALNPEWKKTAADRSVSRIEAVGSVNRHTLVITKSFKVGGHMSMSGGIFFLCIHCCFFLAVLSSLKRSSSFLLLALPCSDEPGGEVLDPHA